jgi:DnaJ family protein A protein 2
MLCRQKRLFASAARAAKYYDLLKVSPSASDEEIKKAYKKAALEHHPDRGGDSDKFKEISHAYSVLSDPSKRQLYDQFGEQGVESAGAGGPAGGYPGEDPMDIFSQVFGGAARRRPGGLARGRDAVYHLELTLEELASGTTRSIAYNRDVACVNCGGRGATKMDPCRRCGGSGVVMTRQNIGFLVHMQTPCPDCGGQGFTVPKDGHCRPCNTSGVVSQKEVFSVAVPRGCPTGHQFRFAGKADQLPGHTAGDVIVQIRTKPHAVFKRLAANSPDLVMKHDLSLADALAGIAVKVTTVDKRSVTLAGPAGQVVGFNDVFVVRNLGLPRFDGSTNGDLYVQFSVKFPSTLASLSAPDREKILAALGKENAAKTTSVSASAGEVFTAERVTSPDRKAKVTEALSSNSHNREQSRQHQFTGGAHPEQCQQQ